MARATLLISCPDKKGLVARLSSFIFENGGNIIDSDHHTSAEALFMARFEWDLKGFFIPREAIRPAIAALAADMGATAELRFDEPRKRAAIWVSRQSHCLHDLLWRHQAGELDCDIPLVVSNHERLRPIAEQYGVPFRHIPVTRDSRAAVEEEQLALLQAHDIDLIVLAKYMQILSDDFLAAFPRCINIHHSFLPAFKGARPYHRAFERGVKLIGATAHYATADLDEGPIIAQDVASVSHRDSVKELIRKGRDVERRVLAEAVRLHLQSRVLVHGNKTVVF